MVIGNVPSAIMLILRRAMLVIGVGLREVIHLMILVRHHLKRFNLHQFILQCMLHLRLLHHTEVAHRLLVLMAIGNAFTAAM